MFFCGTEVWKLIAQCSPNGKGFAFRKKLGRKER
jgi:hypothetical protein